jgi:hypothetical protein
MPCGFISIIISKHAPKNHNLYVNNQILDIDPQLCYKNMGDRSLYNGAVSLSLSFRPSKKLAVLPPSAPIKLYCHISYVTITQSNAAHFTWNWGKGELSELKEASSGNKEDSIYTSMKQWTDVYSKLDLPRWDNEYRDTTDEISGYERSAKITPCGEATFLGRVGALGASRGGEMNSLQHQTLVWKKQKNKKGRRRRYKTQ